MAIQQPLAHAVVMNQFRGTSACTLSGSKCRMHDDNRESNLSDSRYKTGLTSKCRMQNKSRPPTRRKPRRLFRTVCCSAAHLQGDRSHISSNLNLRSRFYCMSAFCQTSFVLDCFTNITLGFMKSRSSINISDLVMPARSQNIVIGYF